MQWRKKIDATSILLYFFIVLTFQNISAVPVLAKDGTLVGCAASQMIRNLISVSFALSPYSCQGAGKHVSFGSAVVEVLKKAEIVSLQYRRDDTQRVAQVCIDI